MKTRIERDTMGEVEVAADKLWGAQTQRSVNNFAIGKPASMPIEVVYAFAYLKKAAALANRDLGLLGAAKADYIARVCNEILSGELDEQFPLVIWQTGSGTHTNMNVNEVVANRVHILQGKRLGQGERYIHPNDDVNMSQSSNDTFPSAMHIAAAKVIHENTLPALRLLAQGLREKVEAFDDIAKIGRTHWMDATPLTLGQEFSGYLSLVENGTAALAASMERVHELALGGTAVGTGINCPEGFSETAVMHIARMTGLPFVPADNRFEALSAHDALIGCHGALKQIAVSLHKMASDIRQLASGPRCGLGEIILPANEPGSSIMPGKVNPSQVEALTMVCAQVMGNDVAVGIGGTCGHFELNVYKPLIIANVLESAALLGDAVRSFHDHCLVGIEPDRERIASSLQRSLMLVTALTPHIGYDRAAEIAKAAHHNGTTLKEEARRLFEMKEEQLDEWLDPLKMLGK